MYDAVRRLIDRICGTYLSASGIFTVHADDRSGLSGRPAINSFQVNHGPAAMRVAFHAGLNAGLAADAPGLIDEELVAGHARSTRHAQTLYSGIFEIGSSARLVTRLADFIPGQ